MTEEEFNEAFKSAKRYKAPGSHVSHVNVILHQLQICKKLIS